MDLSMTEAAPGEQQRRSSMHAMYEGRVHLQPHDACGQTGANSLP